EVANTEHDVSRRLGFADKTERARGAVVAVDPLEARLVEVQLVERRLASVEPVHILHPFLQALVRRVLEQVPVQALVVVPLPPLSELSTHKKQLLARLRIHVAEKQTKIVELLTVIAVHLSDARAL